MLDSVVVDESVELSVLEVPGGCVSVGFPEALVVAAVVDVVTELAVDCVLSGALVVVAPGGEPVIDDVEVGADVIPLLVAEQDAT